MESTLLGQILVDSGLITETQLEECLDLQDRPGHAQPLGELLRKKRLIDEETLNGILSVQQRAIGVDKAQDRLAPADLEQRLAEGSIHQLLSVTRELGAAELLLCSGCVPRVRLNGSLVDLPIPPQRREELKSALFSLLTTDQVAAYYRQRSLDVTLAVSGLGRFRMNVFRHLEGVAGTFRPLAQKPPTLRSLDLPPVVRRFPGFARGLVLVTGPLSSGRSSTIAALVHEINQRQPRHVVTIEDPVELVFRSERAMVSQVEVGTSARSRAAAFLACLRQDPDVIVLGDLDDPETTDAALLAAETGHLVLATAHTPDATRTLLRLLDQYEPERRAQVCLTLAQQLRAILSQQIVPHADGRGVSLATEVLLMNDTVGALLREEKVWQIPMVLQTGRGQGMHSMDDSLRKLVEAKVVSLEEALNRASSPEEFLRLQRSQPHA